MTVHQWTLNSRVENTIRLARWIFFWSDTVIFFKHDAWLKQESVASFKTPECQNKLTCMKSHMKYPNSLKWHPFSSSQVVSSHNNKDIQAQNRFTQDQHVWTCNLCELKRSINIIHGCYKDHWFRCEEQTSVNLTHSFEVWRTCVMLSNMNYVKHEYECSIY